MPRTLDETVDWDPDEERVYVERREFAEMVDYTPQWISKAVHNDYLVDGMPVAQWMVQDRYGRFRGLDVPKSVWNGIIASQKYDNGHA